MDGSVSPAVSEPRASGFVESGRGLVAIPSSVSVSVSVPGPAAAVAEGCLESGEPLRTLLLVLSSVYGEGAAPLSEEGAGRLPPGRTGVDERRCVSESGVPSRERIWNLRCCRASLGDIG